MVTVQLIAKRTFLVREKLVLQTDAWGLPCTRAAGPWLSLRPPAVVLQWGWARDGPAAPAPSTSCTPGTSRWSRGGAWSPIRAAHRPHPASPRAGVSEPWATGALGSPPLSYALLHLLCHPSWWSFSSSPCNPEQRPRAFWRIFKTANSLFKWKKFVQLCTECFWTPEGKKYAVVLPWVFFSTYFFFTIYFKVSAAGSFFMDTLHPLVWNLGFPVKVFGKALLNVRPSCRDLRCRCCWDQGASVCFWPHAGNLGVPGVQQDAALNPHPPGSTEPPENTSTKPVGFESFLTPVLCIAARASPPAAPDGPGRSQPTPGEAAAVAELGAAQPVPSAGQGFACMRPRPLYSHLFFLQDLS